MNKIDQAQVFVSTGLCRFVVREAPQTNEDITLELLKAIERDSSVTQRSLAKQLNIAVGMANAYVRRCVRTGLIKVRQAPARRYSYYLTPKGFKEKALLTSRFLRSSFRFLRVAKEDCDRMLVQISQQNCKTLVLVGDSELSDVIQLIAPQYQFESIETVDGPSGADVIVRRAPDADAYIITSLHRPLDYYHACINRFGAERVWRPPLLQLPDIETLTEVQSQQLTEKGS